MAKKTGLEVRDVVTDAVGLRPRRLEQLLLPDRCMPSARRILPFLCLLFLATFCRGAGTPLVVQLDWVPSVTFAGVLVAKEKGWYEQAGLDVSIRQIDLQAMATSVGPVLKGPNVIGIADGLVLLNARADHKPLKAFATMLQASPLCIMALRQGPIRTFGDLAGRRIGLHSYDHIQLGLMLAHNHLSLGDVTEVDIGDDLTSLIEGKIDAQVAYSTDEPVAIELKGHPTIVFPGYENGFVAYAQVYYTTEDFFRRRPDTLVSFLEVTNRGWREAFAHKKETASMVVDVFMKKNGDPVYQEKALGEVERFATLESASLGSMRISTWEKSCEVFDLPKSLVGELVDLSIIGQLK
jgi:ABC-type nitrate/sulfonate/bicarbonate transport system substrate-binding protein